MADKEVSVRIKAFDDFSSTFNKLSDAGNKIGHGLATAAKVGAVGVAALGTAAGLCVNEFVKAEKVAAQTGAVIKSTGGAANVTSEHVADMAAELRDLSGVEDEVIASAENMLLTFTNIQNTDTAATFDLATQAALDMSVALGEDMTSAAMRLGKALNDPIDGVTALRRVGVQLTDQQEEAIKKFMELGKVEEAQGIILQELQKEFGGSAEAAGKTLGGQLEILKSKFGDLMEEIGGKLAPALSELGNSLLPRIAGFDTTPIVNAFSSLGPVMEKLIPLMGTVTQIIQQIAEAFGPVLGEVMGTVAEALNKVAESLLSSGLLEAFAEFAGVFSSAFVEAAANVATSMMPIATALLNAATPLIQIADKAGVLEALMYAWVAAKVWTTISQVSGALGGVAEGFANVIFKGGTAATVMQGFAGTAVGVMGVAGALAFTTAKTIELIGAIQGWMKANEEMRAANATTTDSFNELYGAIDMSGYSNDLGQYVRDMKVAFEEVGVAFSGHAGDMSKNIDEMSGIFLSWQRDAGAAGEKISTVPPQVTASFDSAVPQIQAAGQKSMQLYLLAILNKIPEAQADAGSIAASVVTGLASGDPAAIDTAYNTMAAWGAKLVETGQATQEQVDLMMQSLVGSMDQSGPAYESGLATGNAAGAGISAGLQGWWGQLSSDARQAAVNANNAWLEAWGGGPSVGGTPPQPHTGGYMHKGGPVRMHSGGIRSDERPAILQKGEYVINRDAVKTAGVSTLDAINSGRPGGGNTYNITIKAEAFAGTPADARRFASMLKPYLAAEGAR